MKNTLIKTRKINGEIYKYFLHEPSFVGEKGCCGIEITPYISIETPENCFGYTDTFLFNDRNGDLYPLHRHHAKYICKQLLKTYLLLRKKFL